jgi:stage V sporulation protein S
MDRFFSKLDLRDIKIDPERSRFSPDDEFEPETGADPATNGNAPESDIATAEPADEAVVEPRIAAQSELDADIEPSAIATNDTLFEANDVLKVSSKSRPSAVAGAIAGVVREIGRAEVQAIGAGATNQAIKAVAIARDYLKETGIDAVCLPAFIDITIDNEDRTAIRLVIEPR